MIKVVSDDENVLHFCCLSGNKGERWRSQTVRRWRTCCSSERLWSWTPAHDGSSSSYRSWWMKPFSQSESPKPCRGQSESSRSSLDASRDKWERNTEEIDLICAAVEFKLYILTPAILQQQQPYGTIHSFIHSQTALSQSTALRSSFISLCTSGRNHCMTWFSSQIITGSAFSHMIFLALQICFTISRAINRLHAEHWISTRSSQSSLQ